MISLRLPLVAAALALSACAADYDPPATPVALPPEPGKPVLQRETVTVSAFLVGASSSLAELNTARCVIARGGRTVTVTTPMMLSIPVHAGAQAPLDIDCSAQIGPRLARAKLRHLPETAIADPADTATRHYPKQIAIRFRQ